MFHILVQCNVNVCSMYVVIINEWDHKPGQKKDERGPTGIMEINEHWF